MEVAGRTEADRKGGHIARLRDDGLVLRETAQTPEEDLASLQDVGRHRYVNTNNLWVGLEALRDTLQARDGVLGLPIIVNRKTVDPSDSDSTPVVQLETAMGAAIGVFEGAARCTFRGGASRRSRRPTTCSRCAPMPTCCTRTTASSSRPSARSRRSSTSTPSTTSWSATSSRASRRGPPSLVACERLQVRAT